MRNRLAVTLGIVGLVLMAVTAAQTDVSGRWEMTFNTDQGSMAATLHLTQDGDGFSGSMESDQGAMEFDGGTITGDKLEWVIEVDAGGTFLEIAMQGTVAGDEISGSADFGGYGGGDWTAKRAN